MTSFHPPRLTFVASVLLLVFSCVGCRTDVVLGQQRRDTDADLGDADGESDAGAHDAETDGDEPDADEHDQLDCDDAMFCLVACGEDLLCAAGCAGRVCAASVEPFDDLSDCALPLCAPECSDFAASSCQTCIFDNCSAYLGPCVGAGC